MLGFMSRLTQKSRKKVACCKAKRIDVVPLDIRAIFYLRAKDHTRLFQDNMDVLTKEGTANG